MTMTTQTFVLLLETPAGERIEWETMAGSGCTAVRIATEVMPDHEVLKVFKKSGDSLSVSGL